jgi:DNA invertase Pin-like site-specific DNA recombinase
MARQWCLEQGLELDEGLSIADLGVSAFTGKNSTHGALAGFLAAANRGKVPKGSILLVESLDRLSRNSITDAVGLLTSIVKSGIRVVSMIDKKEWNEDNINDTMNFMFSVMLFARAHEESATKSDRVRKSWIKRKASGVAVISGSHGPGWALPSADKSEWVLDEVKAASVRKVFDLAISGHGGVSIARMGNQEGWPLPWRERTNDLLPLNRTSHFSKESINPENDGHENKQIQRRANHWFSAAGRGWHADQGDRTQTRLQ